MDPIDAYKIRRVKIEIGEHYPFYSSLEGEDGYGVQCRLYTGQDVLVVEDKTDEGSEAFAETRRAHLQGACHRWCRVLGVGGRVE